MNINAGKIYCCYEIIQVLTPCVWLAGPTIIVCILIQNTYLNEQKYV